MEDKHLYLILVMLFGCIYPLYSMWDGPKVKKQLILSPDKLVMVYKQTMLIQFVLTCLVLLSLYVNGDRLDRIGLGFFLDGLSIILLVLLALLVLWMLNRKILTPSETENIKAKYQEIMYIIPRTTEEYRWAIGLSFIVGATEEILFRGFLYWQLSMHLPSLAALLLTNIIFALLHIGTGAKNALSTFILGMVYSALSIPFGTLWYAIFAHIITDLYAICIGFKVSQPSQNA